ncbi:MAG: hypothetical protein K0S46_1897 [Moraxellaceae bacterium]|jgi:hypothetical protein|nr:hypothetical protein [Moraxellaceae bacterium]
MKPKEMEQWEIAQAQGMGRFILLNGVLGYGVAMFIAMAFFVLDDPKTPMFLLGQAIVWLCGGTAFGAFMWYLQERRYKKAKGASNA